MGNIYRDSYLTIAARSAPNSQGGCFIKRRGDYSSCWLLAGTPAQLDIRGARESRTYGSVVWPGRSLQSSRGDVRVRQAPSRCRTYQGACPVTDKWTLGGGNRGLFVLLVHAGGQSKLAANRSSAQKEVDRQSATLRRVGYVYIDGHGVLSG